jgi:hypothetical protein
MRRALGSLSWRSFGFFIVFAAALSAWTWSGLLLVDKALSFEEHAMWFASLFQRNLLNFFPAYLLVSIVDGFELHGTRRRVALAVALVAGAALTVQARCAVMPTVQYYVYESTQMRYCTTFPTWHTYLDFPSTFITPIVIGGMVMIWVFSRRRDAELVDALHRARAAEIETRRQRIESEMEAMQARVDPDGLLDKLRSIRARYDEALAEGEAMLDALIRDLRLAARRPLAPGEGE